MSLTEHEKQIITNTWSLATKDIKQAGLAIFKQFFEDNPSYQQLFPFRDVQDWDKLKDDRRMKAHAANVMYALGMMIDHIEDTEVFIEMVDKMARSHIRRHLTVQHFENLKLTLVKVLTNVLGASIMNDEAVAAWAKAYSVITDTFMKHLSQSETK